jgi:hypothetical protein
MHNPPQTSNPALRVLLLSVSPGGPGWPGVDITRLSNPPLVMRARNPELGVALGVVMLVGIAAANGQKSAQRL